MAPLPEVPSLEVGEPSPDSLALVDSLLERVTAPDDEDRLTAAAEVETVAPPLVPAIKKRLGALADRASREDMKALLGKLRDQARNEVRERMRAQGQKGEVVTPDYLDIVVRHPQTDLPAWRDLAQVMALSRMLRGIGTVEATRVLIQVYVRFGEFLRVDTQLQLEKLGDRAVAALIETRLHQAPKIKAWAERQLDMLGKGIPSEAVQTTDLEVLADVLRAYGRTRDPDAARIVISFANSERAQVREAARQAVALLGEVGLWQLRDAYETVVGKPPPRDWTWKRVARELFGEYDRTRLAQVYRLFDAGRKAQREGDLAGMKRAFDQVLARSPLFEHGKEMAAGYLDFAHQRLDEDPEAARDALRRAHRLSADESVRRRAESLLLTLEGERLLQGGIADQEIFRRAVELDPENDRARQVRLVVERGEHAASSTFRRWLAAGLIGTVALVAMLLIGLWPRQRLLRAAGPQAPPKDPPAGENQGPG